MAEEKQELQTSETSSEQKCILCEKYADLELDDGTFICDDCAQIQNELSL